MCGAAGPDRGHGLLPAYASAGRRAWAAEVGGGADAAVGGRMIVAAPTALLADSRSGGRGGLLPWALVVTGSVASLAANVAVAEPTATGRVIAAWPSLIGSYELLIRQIRTGAGSARADKPAARNRSVAEDATPARPQSSLSRQRLAAPRATTSRAGASRKLQLQAWRWAQANQAGDGSLPSGKAIAGQYGRRERWGRLVKQAGLEGAFATDKQA